MQIHVHIHHHDRSMSRLADEVSLTNKNIKKMAQELEDLRAEVSETNGIMASAKTLIEGFAQKLQEAIDANNPQALVDLKNELNTSSEGLAAAIAANPLPSDEQPGGGEEPTPGL